MQVARQEIRTIPRPKCLVCQSGGEILYENLSDPLFSAPGLWSFKRCAKEDCGLIWLDPMPRAEDLHLAYEQYFTHSDEEKKGGGMGLRAMLYSCYLGVTSATGAVIGLTRSRAEMKTMFLGD